MTGAGAARMDAGDEAVYLYCFAQARAADRLPPELPAVDPARALGLHHHAGLVALVSPVPRADYTGTAGEAHLADIGWVGPRALRHQAVLEAAQAVTTVFPLPFGTLFSSPAALTQEMDRRRGEIEAVLRRLAGCAEWAVQGELDRDAAVDTRLRAAIADGRYVPAASPGRRHLEEQRLRRELAADLDAWAQQAAGTVAEALRGLSRGFVERRVPAGQALAFNWAFLVPEAALPAFRQTLDAAARGLAGQGLSLVCKGPWPCYSFAAPES